MTVGLRVEGIGKIRTAIRNSIAHELKDALVVANKDLARAVIAKALPNVPVGKTGRLKKSVRGLGNVSGALGKAGNAAVPYAAAVHWGRGTGALSYSHGRRATAGGGAIKARPFLYDAAKDIERDVEDAYLAEIDRILRTISDH